MRLRMSRIAIGLAIASTWSVLGESASAQRRGRPSRAPDPVNQTITTEDGVVLGITYYAGLEGRQTTPLILLHDFNESRAIFESLARILQDPKTVGAAHAETRAVVTVDLRGHGDSTTALGLDGRTYRIDPSKFRTRDFDSMVLYDLEAVRQFLIEENDAERLNINKLGVLGSGMGANVAVAWTARDWSIPPLAVRKQGQDIKATALISPQWNFRGLSLQGPIRQPGARSDVSVLLAYGAESETAASDAKKILGNLEPFHPEPPRDQVAELKDLFVFPLDTTLQGSELLTRDQFDMTPEIDRFFRRRLDDKPFPWTKRLLD